MFRGGGSREVEMARLWAAGRRAWVLSPGHARACTAVACGRGPAGTGGDSRTAGLGWAGAVVRAEPTASALGRQVTGGEWQVLPGIWSWPRGDRASRWTRFWHLLPGASEVGGV